MELDVTLGDEEEKLYVYNVHSRGRKGAVRAVRRKQSRKPLDSSLVTAATAHCNYSCALYTSHCNLLIIHPVQFQQYSTEFFNHHKNFILNLVRLQSSFKFFSFENLKQKLLLLQEGTISDVARGCQPRLHQATWHFFRQSNILLSPEQ